MNSITLSPVHDSNGVYRYSIGLLSDSAEAITDGASIQKLRSVLPSLMQADAQPAAYDLSLRQVSEEAQLTQYREAAVEFRRLRWSMAWGASLSEVLGSGESTAACMSSLESAAPKAASKPKACVSRPLDMSEIVRD